MKQLTVVVVGAVVAAAGIFLGGFDLHPRRLRRHLTRQRVVPLLLALTVYGGVYAVTWQDLPPRGDEGHYMIEAYSLVKDRDRNLAGDYMNPERIAPMFGSFVPGAHAKNYSGDLRVAISVHSVGLPVVLAPAAALSDDVRLMRVEMIVLTAFAAYLLLSILRRIARGGSWLVYAAWGGVVFSLPFLSYSTQVYPEIPGAILLLLAVRMLLEPELSQGKAAIVGTAAALMPWLHIRFTYLSVVLVGAAVFRLVREQSRADSNLSARLLAAMPAIVPLLASALLLGLANERWYGSPALGAAYRFTKGASDIDLARAYETSLGGILQPTYGWLPFAPLHLLAFSGLVYLCWRRRQWAIVALPAALVYLFLVGATKAAAPGGGSSFPARLQLVVVPLAAVPLFLALKESRVFRALAVPLAALTLALTVVGVSRMDALIYTEMNTPNSPSLPLAQDLAPVWPRVAGDREYADWPHALGWIGGMLLVGGLAAPRTRTRRRGAPL